MLRANADLALREHVRRNTGESDRLAAAVVAYDDALVTGERFVRLIEGAKRGAWTSAFAETIRAPAMWPLAARFGAEAMVRRMSAWLRRSSYGARPCRAS